MSTLHLQLVTPVETLFNEEVEKVIANTETGQITILPHHTHLVTILKPGEMVIQQNGERKPLFVAGGTIEMNNNQLVILADAAENAHNVDIEAAEAKAKELAEMLETEEEMDIKTYTMLQQQLTAEQAKLRTATKWRA